MDRSPRTPGADRAVVARPPEARAAGRSRPVEMLAAVAGGFAMGSADLVPGVSGGTVALVIGIYERLVANIRQGAHALSRLLRLDGRGGVRSLAAVEWVFLAPLLVGIVGAVATLAGVLRHLLETQPVALSALFFGLIVGSTLVATDEVRAPRPGLLAVGALVAVVAFGLLGLRSGRFADPSLAVFFAGGALAVCAMILPGVSGSFILLMIGLYDPVLAAVDDRQLVIVGVVALGAATGLGAFSTLLNWLLRRHHDLVLACLIGLMAGSLRVLWPWPAGPDGVGDTRLAAPVAADLPLTLALAVMGAIGVVLLGRLARTATR